MKVCIYCGRENDSALTDCRECGTELPTQESVRTTLAQRSTPPPLPAKPKTVVDPSARPRRCTCGSDMQFHRPVSSYLRGGVLLGYRMRYRCVNCRREAIVPTPAIMVVCAVGILIFGWVFVWMLTGNIQAAMQRKPLGTLVAMIGCPTFFVVCLQLFVCGIWNRLKYRLWEGPPPAVTGRFRSDHSGSE